MDIKWGKVKLGDVAKFISTNTLSRDFLNDNEGEIYDIHYGDVLIKFDSIVDTNTESIPRINPEVDKTFKNFAKDGDIIMADTAEDETVGKVCELQNIGDKRIVSGLHTIWMRFKEGYFAPNYLGYYLNTPSFHKQLLPYMHGTKVTSLSKDDVKSVYIFYPILKDGSTDLNKQIEITSILNDIEYGIKQKENLLEKKKNIKNGLMQNTFLGNSWTKVKLETCCKITMGQSPEGIYYNELGKGLPLIQGNADIVNRKTVISTFTSKITKTCDEGDIILSVRAPVGTVGKATFKACIGRGVCAIKFPNDYLFYYFEYIEDKWEEYSTGSTFDSINGKTLKNIEIPLPTESEQERISKLFNDIDVEIIGLNKEIEKLRFIKEGLIQEIFDFDRDIIDGSK